MILLEIDCCFSEDKTVWILAHIIFFYFFDIGSSTKYLIDLTSNHENFNVFIIVEISNGIFQLEKHFLAQRIQVFGTIHPDSANFPVLLNLQLIILKTAY